MKQGYFLTSFATFILLIIILLYMGENVYSAVLDPLRTVPAILYSAEESITVSGIIIRDEQVVASSGEVCEPIFRDGAKVAKGQTISVRYSDDAARREMELLSETERRLALLLGALTESATSSDIVRIDKNISGALCELSFAVGRGEYSSIDEMSSNLKSYVFERSFAFTGNSDAMSVIETLEADRDRYKSALRSTVAATTAPISGYYSHRVDGYEELLSPSAIDTLTPSVLRELEAASDLTASISAAGKLVSGYHWYFAAVFPAAETRKLTERMETVLRFSDDRIGEVPVRVEHISEETGGETVIVFRASSHMAETVSKRREIADVILSTYEGVRIPKEAIRVHPETGEVGVYCIIAMQAKFIPTERIFDTENYYIAAYDRQSKSGIRPGDEIVVSSKDLYDGKILR